ncbi:MAG: hypothetical protein H0U57_13680 [Tatlockia sp.]|nr:hypothetical protein [Tatlockia sp.]
MNTRLVWNFEIKDQNPINFDDLKDNPEELRWEARYFWPRDAIIVLNGLDARFLLLSNYEVKQRKDNYSVLADLNFNLKQRLMQLFYKPLLKEVNLLHGYGKKINLTDYASELVLPGSNLRSSELLKLLADNAQEVEVEKEALIYKLPTEPKLKLELARLEVRKKIYFSLCVEGRSQRLVESIATQLIPNQKNCDYVSFLKQVLAHAN